MRTATAQSIKPIATAAEQFSSFIPLEQAQETESYLDLAPKKNGFSAEEAPRTSTFKNTKTHWLAPPFPPLALETRSAVPTEAAAYYLSRKPQTLRQWACLENGPLRPIRINGRLSWRVADIQAVLSGEAA